MTEDEIVEVLTEALAFSDNPKANATTVLAALTAKGYVVRPVEPSEKMKAAGARAVLDKGVGDFGSDDCVTMSARINEKEAAKIYRAMIAVKE